MNTRFFLFSLPVLAMLSACSDSMQEDTPAAVQTTPSGDYSAFSNRITVREIMDSLIDPNADKLWNSVRVVSDVNGIVEYYPETDEEWSALRISAVSLIEGVNALMLPGRRVAPPGAVGEFPEYEFTPEEVEEKISADRSSFTGFARNLQDAAFELLDAVDSRDTEKLTEWGAYLDEACEACHSNYWYRAGI